LIMQAPSGGTTPSTPRDADVELYATIPLDEVARAIKDIADGRPVIVVDDADRENEGDIIFAASKATPELLAFTIRYGRGLICVPMLGQDLDRLNVPQMTSHNQEHHGTAFTISVDARHDITTGISAADRAKTIQLLASSTSTPDDLVRPGHVFPLRYAEGGVLRRRGHTVVAVDVLEGAPFVGDQDPLFARMWAMQRSFMYRDMGTIGVDVVSWSSDTTLDQSMRLVPERRRPVRGRR